MTEPVSDLIASLEVSRKELVRALQTLRKYAAQANESDAFVSFDADALVIRLGGVEVRAPARGSWRGEVAVPGRFLANFARSVPKEDPVRVRVEAGRFKIGLSGVRCRRQATTRAPIQIPVNAGLPDVLRVPLLHTEEEIERAGLTRVVREARERRDQLLARAAKTLVPLDLDAEDLVAFLDAKLRQKFARE